MCLHRSLLGMMGKSMFENSKGNFTRQPDTSHSTDEVTPECLLLAATTVKHSLDNWAGGSVFCLTFEADIYKGMQSTVLDTDI